MMAPKHIVSVVISLLVGQMALADADPVEVEFEDVPVAPVSVQELHSVMGISAWTMSLTVDAGENREVRIYAKEKGKEAKILLVGALIRNDQGAGDLTKRVIVTIDGLKVRPWQPKLKIGVGVSVGPTLTTDTMEVANPIPKGVYVSEEQGVLNKDRKGRIMLVQGNKMGMTAYPGVTGQDYAIYVQLVPWDPKTQ